MVKNGSWQQEGDFNRLGVPEPIEEDDLNPFSIGKKLFIPAAEQPQVQFLYRRSMVDALRLVTALERYRKTLGQYPKRLEQLVPDFIEELPRDSMSPLPWNRKPGFVYQVKEQTYILISESKSYDFIKLARRQVYGHDGNYEEIGAGK